MSLYTQLQQVKSEEDVKNVFEPFEQAYQLLDDKLRPQVFTLGFLHT